MRRCVWFYVKAPIRISDSYALKAGRLEHAIGWYHSHPGYGCWLSGIDVSTQMNNQKFQDPFVAVVVSYLILLWLKVDQRDQIDPNRTISAGKVDIGAFRTYPENYTPAHVSQSEYQSIPLNKIEDFGVHANQYYQLDVEIFKSTLDNDLLAMLWNKYWVNTLSQSPLVSVCWSDSFGRTKFAYGIARIGRMLCHSSRICIRN